MSQLSNFEKGFAMYVEVLNSKTVNSRHAPTTRKMNESICLMASEDEETMKTVVVNNWVISRAYHSAYGKKYELI